MGLECVIDYSYLLPTIHSKVICASLQAFFQTFLCIFGNFAINCLLVDSLPPLRYSPENLTLQLYKHAERADVGSMMISSGMLERASSKT
ncbi:Uncharacterized protein BM_BM17765 [Brugia malayi]|uniref:Uncharacterized protein n=1 Tax=Brugia malayi TaxID=6279 RepID=A0A4E9FQB3_BRUMA|nr:Uncharacterized protein BM_BM17765 [Brugia malayi]VIO98682.1 Uncharacterized protein BM_BM17765 [Brugia malayi]